jgi:hypothetical protein
MTLLEKTLGALALTLGLALCVETAYLRHESAEKAKVAQVALVATAPSVGASVGTAAKEPAIAASASPANQAAVKKLQAASPGAKVTEHVALTAEIHDEVPVDDPHHRFHLDGNMLERHELYHLDTVIVTSANGDARVARTDFTELDPVTGLTISDASSSPKIVTNFQFLKEPPAAAPFFHPRAVAGFGGAGEGALLGAGVELLNGERFGAPWDHTNLSVLGLYNTSTKAVSGAAVLGFRPFNWNVSIGPAYFFPSGRVGGAATIELTR